MRALLEAALGKTGMARHDYATHHRVVRLALTAPPAAEAQQAAQVARIGLLANNPAANPRLLEASGRRGTGPGDGEREATNTTDAGFLPAPVVPMLQCSVWAASSS